MNERKEKSLLYWFKERRNHVILKSLDLHIEKVHDTCEAAIELIHHLTNPDLQQAEKLLKRISMHERAADHIQDELANEIARGLLPPEVRANLFRLVRLTDATANWVKTGGKNLLMLVKLEVETNKFQDVLNDFEELVRLTIESVKVFRKMIAALGRDDQTILDNRQIIEDRERECDDVHSSVREEILVINENYGFSVHFLLLDTAKNFENASDSITNAADVLYTIVMLGVPT